MIGVTGAGGTLGSELVRQLAAAKVPFRAAHFSKDKAEAARAEGIEATVIDYRQPATLREAFQGCERLFLLGPTVEDPTRLELAAVEAARAAGVRHVVKQSVLGAEGEDYSFAKVHRPVERALEESGLDWTFLRPNSFMQNVVTFMAPTIRSEGRFYSSCGQARIAHVDVRDIAAVAVKALTASGHAGKTLRADGARGPDLRSGGGPPLEGARPHGRPRRRAALRLEGGDAGRGDSRADRGLAARSRALLPRGPRQPSHGGRRARGGTRAPALRGLRAGLRAAPAGGVACP